jgi:hypothetical protein
MHLPGRRKAGRFREEGEPEQKQQEEKQTRRHCIL